ncbi:MAG: response regulator [Bacilli bacterium]|nr:response regulator [Bacilli bacterium]
MIVNIGISVSFLIVLLIIMIVYFSKEKIDSMENKIFKKMIRITIIGLIIDTLIYYVVLFKDGSRIPLYFLIKGLFIYYIVWMAFFVLYGYIIFFSVKNDNNKKYIKFKFYLSIFYFISLIATIILPIEIDLTDVYVYPNGLATSAQYFILPVGMIIITISGLLNKNKLLKKESIPIIACIIFGSISTIIQYYHHEFLFIVPGHAIAIILMYFTIENPDLKLIADLKIARDEAEKANRAKSDFLSSMSHEIRTPLNAIAGLSEDILTYKNDVPKQVKEDSQDIIDASNTLLEIVGNILDISKIESNKLDIVDAPYNFVKEIKSLAKINKTRIGKKPIEMIVDIAEDVPYELIGDKVHIKEIVNNLLSNAIKYTDEGKVILRVKCINNDKKCSLIISVEDTGRGIKKESISRLFDKFDRLDVERNTTIEGTGLGLAITKKLVEMMGGTINVNSTFGKGSIFVVNIVQKISKISKPLVKEADNSKKKRIDYKNKRILVVDDNELNLKVADRALSDLEAKIDNVQSGIEAIKYVKKNKYDVILLDIMMPEMNGEETLQELKKIEGFDTPVVALTADALTGAKDKYLSEGFDGYIAKPFTRDQIKEKLDKIFNN